MDAQSTHTDLDRFVADIPSALKEQIDILPESNKEFAIRAFRRELGLQLRDEERIEDELSRKREKRAKLSAKKEDLHREESSIESEIEELEAALEDAQASDSFEDALDEFLEFMEERGTHVNVQFPQVQKIAEEHRVSTTEVLETLYQMSDLPASRFGLDIGGDESNDGLSAGDL
ncbi:hypothetical protein SAMN04488063_1117 [Halopelagius inordinatus]|uniref:Uncharacterized protein n=1 Tax=Halopelagius inordinatus TaxID=553467 RepID=A0A1I2NBM1_9EURY|nr:hypothetical protein [Halopelagius inordinatus]SFG00908.1 hypothetical protein SAMN04488063_1117 [Halopelagius inordinatus]